MHNGCVFTLHPPALFYRVCCCLATLTMLLHSSMQLLPRFVVPPFFFFVLHILHLQCVPYYPARNCPHTVSCAQLNASAPCGVIVFVVVGFLNTACFCAHCNPLPSLYPASSGSALRLSAQLGASSHCVGDSDVLRSKHIALLERMAQYERRLEAELHNNDTLRAQIRTLVGDYCAV